MSALPVAAFCTFLAPGAVSRLLYPSCSGVLIGDKRFLKPMWQTLCTPGSELHDSFGQTVVLATGPPIGNNIPGPRQAGQERERSPAAGAIRKSALVELDPWTQWSEARLAIV
ncbi:hypothetical protein QBC33DRAFT_510449 [Phialemonium atrogriseum]|uniref:Uncharacterized protein n=1 Tax=Phialemonium atrogriseum TaxID=1093897 RepID=A0AAJ0C9E6_9PEZI|nr:uncharacterized protein QBC33DRAFT_510449 [Phialemonium atrogriseum]KAK1772599.1 hypothetical protein QBC33DRAFT_510449 [Phialemonium atrogriseum]